MHDRKLTIVPMHAMQSAHLNNLYLREDTRAICNVHEMSALSASVGSYSES